MYRSYSSQTTNNLFMPRSALIILSLLTLQSGFSQNSGRWVGTGEYLAGSPFTKVMNNMAAQKNLVFNIAIDGSVSGNMITGYNRSKAVIPNEDGNQLFTISGKYDPLKQSLLLIITHFKSKPDTSDSYLTFRCPDSVYYDLSVSRYNNRTKITGVANPILNKNASVEWVGAFTAGLCKNVGKNIDMHILPLRIRFDNEANISLEPTEMIQTVYRDTVAATVKRFANIQRIITLDTSFIKLELYDNGEIDGDIATLILDGKTIIDKQLLSVQPATVFINVPNTGSEHTLELFANNLGTIPPNTALLVLTCNKKRYEISLSSNEIANGTVKLVFKP